MKTTIALIVALVSTASFAGLNPGSSWEEILSDYSVREQAPQVSFSANGNTTLVSLMKTCYDAASDSLKAEVMFYDRVDQGDNEIWVELGKGEVSASRVYTKQICGGQGDHCEPMITITQEYPLSPAIAVTTNYHNDREDTVLFTKQYNVPACK